MSRLISKYGRLGAAGLVLSTVVFVTGVVLFIISVSRGLSHEANRWILVMWCPAGFLAACLVFGQMRKNLRDAG